MRARRLADLLLVAAVLPTFDGPATAAEYAFSTYALGSTAFGAGAAPPAGVYLTMPAGYYSAQIGGALNFGGLTINAGAKFEGFSSGINLLYAPQGKFLSGSPALAD